MTKVTPRLALVSSLPRVQGKRSSMHQRRHVDTHMAARGARLPHPTPPPPHPLHPHCSVSHALPCPCALPVPAVSNTERNGALRLEDGSYAPAHMLPDARLERAGRQSRVERAVRAHCLSHAQGHCPVCRRCSTGHVGGHRQSLPPGQQLPGRSILGAAQPSTACCLCCLPVLPLQDSVKGVRRTAALLIIGDEILSAKVGACRRGADVAAVQACHALRGASPRLQRCPGCCRTPAGWLSAQQRNKLAVRPRCACHQPGCVPLPSQVEDVNTHFLCAELRAIGWRVCKASCGAAGRSGG